MTEKTRFIIGSAILLVAIFLLAAGIKTGEPLVVLHKAIFICLECIGIG